MKNSYVVFMLLLVRCGIIQAWLHSKNKRGVVFE